MNILRIIKELYTGKNNFIAKLGLFGLIGIMAISFNEIVSAFTGYTLYAIFSMPSDKEIIFFSMLGIMIFIYFTGYIYQFVHESFENEQTRLSSISMNCFTTFLKMLPVMFVWGIYLGLIFFVSYTLFYINKLEFWVFLIFIIAILPFINMVFLIFAKDFKYEYKLFSPIILVSIIKKYFVKVFIFLIQFVIIGALLSTVSAFLFKYSFSWQTRHMQLLYILLLLCISSYFQQVLNLAYYKGLTDILKRTDNYVKK